MFPDYYFRIREQLPGGYSSLTVNKTDNPQDENAYHSIDNILRPNVNGFPSIEFCNLLLTAQIG